MTTGVVGQRAITRLAKPMQRVLPGVACLSSPVEQDDWARGGIAGFLQPQSNAVLPPEAQRSGRGWNDATGRGLTRDHGVVTAPNSMLRRTPVPGSYAVWSGLAEPWRNTVEWFFTSKHYMEKPPPQTRT